MRPRVLIATGNAGKLREMLEVLDELPIEFVSLCDLKLKNEVEESGSTYKENAFLKADFFHELTGMPVIAEDSGLEVSALTGELGIKTRRWGAGENATDEEWLAYFLNRMETENDRRAVFNCAAAFVSDSAREIFIGKTHGLLTRTPECPIPHGVPASAIFIPEGKAKVFAAMTPSEKNAVSHRGKAMHTLKAFLEKGLA